MEVGTLAQPSTPFTAPAMDRVEASPCMVRFVDTQFNDAETNQQIRSLFPEALNVTIKPMPLREIFIALAKSSRKAAA